MALVFSTLVFLCVFIFVACVEYYVLRTYRKYSKISLRLQIKGCEIARRILDRSGLHAVAVGLTGGGSEKPLQNRREVLGLPKTSYGKTSALAVGTAAYEATWLSQMIKRPAILLSTTLMRRWFSKVVLIGFLLFLVGMFFGGHHFIFTAGTILLVVYVLFACFILPLRLNIVYATLRQLEATERLSSSEEKALYSVMIAVALSPAGGIFSWLSSLLVRVRGTIVGDNSRLVNL